MHDFEDSQFTQIVESCVKDYPNIKALRMEQSCRIAKLPELSRTMAYTTRKTVNRLVRKQLHLNHVVPERPKEE